MGKMMGRSLHSPMAVNTSGVNKGPAPERPISMLGFTCMHRQIVAVVDDLEVWRSPGHFDVADRGCLRHSAGKYDQITMQEGLSSVPEFPRTY